MSTRRETSERKLALEQELRRECETGLLRPGSPAPSVRELAVRYGISPNVVRQVLGNLLEDGLLYTVPRRGTFVGDARKANRDELYLLILPQNPGPQYTQLKVGFERRISELGCGSITMRRDDALARRRLRELPSFAGLFDHAYRPHDGPCWGADGSLPRVGYGAWIEDPAHTDVVTYDNAAGGKLATQHLMEHGHSAIAFLAVHPAGSSGGQHLWSPEREQGWREAMQTAGWYDPSMAFRPEVLPGPDHEDIIASTAAAAEALLARRDITAVVTPNSLALRGLLRALQRSGRESKLWPAAVTFGANSITETSTITEVFLPWDEIGSAAATLLWERKRGRVEGPPVRRLVPVRLISRLTSRAGWSDVAPLVLTAFRDP